MKQKSLLLFAAALLVITDSVAQFGPAGIGSSASNILWLRSEDLSALTDGDNITSWPDNSGNSNDLSQPTASLTPEYQSGIINGFPVVRFNKTNNRIRRTGFTTFPTTAITEIYVNKNNGETSDGILSNVSTAHHNHFFFFV